MKRKHLALLLASLITLGTLTSCDLNALLESYLETTPTASNGTVDGTTADIPSDTLHEINAETLPSTDFEEVFTDAPETIPDGIVTEIPDTLPPAETEPEGPKPLETSTTVPSFTPIGKWELATPNLTGTPGTYSAGSHEAFRPVGNVKMEWIPDASQKLNLKDGSMEDWATLGLLPAVITSDNMISWSGLHEIPEGWQTSAYFIADSDYLYMGLYIVDPVVVACTPDNPSNYSSGDCFQISIDFGRKLGWILENDPDTTSVLTNTKCVFYSFAYNGDEGEIHVRVQESDEERTLNSSTGTFGSTGKTEDGWCAEVAIPWEELYHDYVYKSYLDAYPDIAIPVSRENPFQLGMSFYYLNHVEENGIITWAAGTHSGFTGTDEDGWLLNPDTNPPLIRWDVYDTSMNVYLPWRSDLHFNCYGMKVED